jgi:hypothetical protein
MTVHISPELITSWVMQEVQNQHRCFPAPPMTNEDCERVEKEMHAWQEKNAKGEDMGFATVGLADFLEGKISNGEDMARFTQ